MSSNPATFAVGSSLFESSRGNKYTLVAVPDAGTLTQVLLVPDPYNKGLGTDKGRIRVLNAAYNPLDVDGYVYTPTSTIATTGPEVPAVTTGPSNLPPATIRSSSPGRQQGVRPDLTAAGTRCRSSAPR